jgi:hypothetical protein
MVYLTRFVMFCACNVCILPWHVVGADMLIGTIVPILKKPNLNPNDVANYRPITVSTSYSKLLQELI